jgi:hypothetical protein
MPRAVNVCPHCGASVTPYAAGCSVCGADLERLRRQRARSVSQRLRTASLPSFAGDAAQNVLLTVLMIVLALFAPLFGLAVAALVAFDRNRRGERTMRNMAVAAGTLAAIGFFVPLSLGQLGPVAS